MVGGTFKFGGLWDGNQYAYDGAVNFEKAVARESV